jgi:hypothetical protein
VGKLTTIVIKEPVVKSLFIDVVLVLAELVDVLLILNPTVFKDRSNDRSTDRAGGKKAPLRSQSKKLQ